jgi:predicted Zn-dependent protease
MAIPALMFLGVLLGSNGRPEAAGRRPLLRAGAVAMATLCAALFATSAVLPSLSASKANQALVEAAGSPSQVAQAQSTAQLASRLDPLSDAGLRVEATVAGRRGEFTRARQLLVLATERNPSDITAWSQLTVTELVLHDKRAALQARRRATALDPIGGRLQETVAQPRAGNALRTTPPRKSATARPVSR